MNPSCSPVLFAFGLLLVAQRVLRRRAFWIASLVGLAVFAASARAQGPEIDWGMAAGAGGFVSGTGGGAPVGRSIFVLDPTIPIPSNGSILIVSDFDEPVVEVWLVDGSGALIPGTVRRVEQSYWAWKADALLPVGDITVNIVNGLGTATIAVVDAMQIEPPAMITTPELVVSQAITSLHFCRQWSADPATAYGAALVDDTSFAAKEVGQVFVQPHLSTSAVPALVHQFLYQLFMNGEQTFRFYEPFRGDAYGAGPYAAQQDEYCFGFRAMDLTMSDVHPYEELTPLCVSHGALPDLAERDSVVPDSLLDRLVCQSPPAGFEERWCTINRECEQLATESRTEGNGCLLYGYTCLNEALPRATPSVAGGMSGGSQSPVRPSTGGVSGDLGTGGMQAMDPEPERARVVRSGCGCLVGGQRDSSVGAPLLLAFGLFVAAQRVLRRRR
jgi:hypothetical protein